MGLMTLLTVKEVASYLQTSKQQVRRMIQSGELTAVRVGREYRVPAAALETWPALQSFLIAVVTPLFYVSE